MNDKPYIISDAGVKIYNTISNDLIDKNIIKRIDKTVDIFNEKIKTLKAPFEDVVGYLSDYKLIKTNKNCGGYCNFKGKEIAYVSGGIETIIHEVCHSIQADMGLLNDFSKLLSDNIRIEQ